ncbi:MAG: hypothetical protein NC415_11200 [bacterium]|nr:hypothetical protein [bacterium]
MKQKERACFLCGLLLVLTIIDYRYGLLCLGEPLVGPMIACMVADEYDSAVNVPYHYLGSKMLDQERTEGADWKGAFYYYREPWAFVINDREEFETEYAAYGMDGTYAEAFDYAENMLVLSINYPLDQIYAMEREVAWQEDVPYLSPEFSYKNKPETSMIYYYEVPRKDVRYEKEDKVYTAKLHLSNPVYSEELREHINFFPFFNKWGWAFDKFNYGR